MLTRLRVGALFLLTSLGCGGGPIGPDPAVSDLRSAPTTVMISGIRVELQVSLNRDFMPISPPDGQPLVASVRLPEAAAVLVVERVWVLFGQDMWSAIPERVPGTRDWTARDGPKWGPGVTVDVVARLRHPNGSGGFVRSADQLIRASW